MIFIKSSHCIPTKLRESLHLRAEWYPEIIPLHCEWSWECHSTACWLILIKSFRGVLNDIYEVITLPAEWPSWNPYTACWMASRKSLHCMLRMFYKVLTMVHIMPSRLGLSNWRDKLSCPKVGSFWLERETIMPQSWVFLIRESNYHAPKLGLSH